MKALILAAGYGTRLKPFTEKLPKPLFPVAGTPLIDITIAQLVATGCDQIVINTHHLADQLKTHIDSHTYPVPIALSHESKILGTGGAIRKVAKLLGNNPFWVVNSDILHDIPLKPIYDFHLQHSDPATLVLVDDPTFNTVWIDDDRNILHFQKQPHLDLKKGRWCTFSGIQVVDPDILDHIPESGFYAIIDAYRSMKGSGKKVRGYFTREAKWEDLGTPDRFQKAVRNKIAPALVTSAKKSVDHQVKTTPLAGDGSDRRWSRLYKGDNSVILCEHGITMGPETEEVDAFVAIGNHLYTQGVYMPKILDHDRFSGQVYLEDLGNVHLQSLVAQQSDSSEIAALYGVVIQRLFKLATDGAKGFDLDWAYQTPFYDKALILEKECRYFLDAFVNGWCGLIETWETYAKEFEHVADSIANYGIEGLLHRDMQSRNVMMKDLNDPYFIDFQGARLGPVQYDLASLLIDPYVDLSEEVRNSITQKALTFYANQLGCDQELFERGFTACALSRNLQILGAFANLSQNKGKSAFAQYIPKAFERLQFSLAEYKMKFGSTALPKLENLVWTIKCRLPHLIQSPQ